MHIGFLDDGRQRLLHRAPRLEKGREIGAGAQARDTKFDTAGPGLPVAIAMAVTLRQSLGGLLAVVGAGLGTDLQLHQTFGGKADHLTQQIGISALLHQRAQVHHGFGHRVYPSVQVGSRNPTLPRNPMATDTYTIKRDVTGPHQASGGMTPLRRMKQP